jgi:hypothetical protein
MAIAPHCTANMLGVAAGLHTACSVFFTYFLVE